MSTTRLARSLLPLLLLLVLSSSCGEEPGKPEVATTSSALHTTLTVSSRISATSNGQTIQNRRITVNDPFCRAGIEVNGRSNVTIRNVEILHYGCSAGISFDNAPNLHIENVRITYMSAPTSGPNSSAATVNINGSYSSGVVIERARLERGSSGIYLYGCGGARMTMIEGHDMRGPFPRGQCVQVNESPGALLEDFSCESCETEGPCASWTEDNISVYHSANVTVRRGLVEGNNSPTGDGVMFEARPSDWGGLCEDVDAVRQGNGNFAGYPAFGVTFRRTRGRDLMCWDQGRGNPSSGGLAWAGSPQSSSLALLDSQYMNTFQVPFMQCNGGGVWDAARFTGGLELTEVNGFTPRAPLRLDFSWLSATADLFCHSTATQENRVAISTGSAFEETATWSTWCGAEVSIGDFDGDGQRDISCHYGNTTHVQVNRGSSFQLGYVWLDSPNFGANCTSLLPGDFNGDGKTDLLCHESNGVKRVALSTGTGFVDGGIWDNWCGASVFVGDFNGDGKDDITCHYGDKTHVRTSTGYSFDGGAVWLDSPSFGDSCDVLAPL